MSAYDMLEVTLDEDVVRVALDRPENLNTLNEQMHDELAEVFTDVQKNYADVARVMVLTGNGDAFSAGGNLEWLKERNIENEPPYTFHQGEQLIKSLVDLELPTIARVHGDAVGLGATLAILCDISVAAKDVRFGDPHVVVGLVAGDGGAAIWPLLTGLNDAKEFLMTGELLTGSEAAEMGLINYAVPADEVDGKVQDRISALAEGPQIAVRYTKMLLNEWLHESIDMTLREGIALERISQHHADHEEALNAFIEDRAPEYPSSRKG
jgi:enoyl-CoA hydratase